MKSTDNELLETLSDEVAKNKGGAMTLPVYQVKTLLRLSKLARHFHSELEVKERQFKKYKRKTADANRAYRYMKKESSRRLEALTLIAEIKDPHRHNMAIRIAEKVLEMEESE